jgi:hypothetical protein
MHTEAEAVEQVAKWYDIPYPATAYTFPQEALIHNVVISNEYLQFELTDGRLLAIPLWWLPSVNNAPLEERQKFTISRNRKLVIWDPDECAINDEVRIDDYLHSREESPANSNAS